MGDGWPAAGLCVHGCNVLAWSWKSNGSPGKPSMGVGEGGVRSPQDGVAQADREILIWEGRVMVSRSTQQIRRFWLDVM